MKNQNSLSRTGNMRIFLYLVFFVAFVQSSASFAEYTTNKRYIPDLNTQQGFISEAIEHAQQGVSFAESGDFAAAEEHARAAYKSAKRVSSQGQARNMNQASGHIRSAIKAAKDSSAENYISHAKAAINEWSNIDLKAD